MCDLAQMLVRRHQRHGAAIAVAVLIATAGTVLVGGQSLASPDAIIEPVRLPTNWNSLKESEKFEVFRGSQHLIPAGDNVGHMEIDCRRRRVSDPSTGSVLKFGYPTRETGWFDLKLTTDDPGAAGRLDVLMSVDLHPGKRIFVLIEPGLYRSNKSVPRIFSHSDLVRVATLFQAYNSRWVNSSRHPIRSYVLTAAR